MGTETNIPGRAGNVSVVLPVGQDGSTTLATKTSGNNGTDRSITATTVSQSLMGANASRVGLMIANDTATDVWINFGGTAAATAGSRNKKIAANGGYMETSIYTGAITIIAASGTAAITALEF